MMHAAVTGPRTGATRHALIAVAQTLCAYNVTVLHNGDCIGVDKAVYYLARAFGIYVILHPPKNYKWRAFCGDHADEWREEKGFHGRDRDMVNESEFLISVPDGISEHPAGGTGWTTEYAREVNKPLVLIWPSGNATYERWEKIDGSLLDNALA
jgi:hypothetical protein